MFFNTKNGVHWNAVTVSENFLLFAAVDRSFHKIAQFSHESFGVGIGIVSVYCVVVDFFDIIGF